MENFSYVFLKALEGQFIDRMDQNEEITAQYLNNKDFQTAVGQNLLKKVYEQIHREKQATGNVTG
jgi:type I restriction enzyme, R subunit